MTRHSFAALLFLSMAVSFTPAAPADSKTALAAVAAAKDVSALADLLQGQIHALPDLMLQVKDADSLARIVAPLEAHIGVIEAIVARLKQMPVPSAAKRTELTKKMREQDAAHAKTKHAAMMQHMEKLPPDLREKLRAEMGKFFASLDANKDTLKKYFAPDEPAAPAAPPEKAGGPKPK